MSTPNPISGAGAGTTARVSTQSFLIAGLQVTVFGLAELPAGIPVACLWLQHPRQGDQHAMAPIATRLLQHWHRQAREAATLGLIGIAFDAPNHGTRMRDVRRNEAWRGGNEHHAPDMFAQFQGMRHDLQQLMQYLPAYVFPAQDRAVVRHMVLGVSLGGHATWHCLLHEPRVTAGIAVIGGADYAALMSDRARLSRRPSWTEGQGRRFFGSVDFPPVLLEALRRDDPAALFLGDPRVRDDLARAPDPTDAAEQRRLAALLRDRLGGKRIQCLSGGADKLVPYRLSAPFLAWLKRAIASSGAPAGASAAARAEAWKSGAGSGWMVSAGGGGDSDKPARWHSPDWTAGAGSGWMVSAGMAASASESASDTMEGQAAAVEHREMGPMRPAWAPDTGIVLEDLVFPGVGHECTPAMLDEAARFVATTMHGWIRELAAEPAAARL